MNKPPEEIIPIISSRLKSAVSNLAPGKTGGVFYIETETGRNLTVLHTIDRDNFDLQGAIWVGKSWGKTVYGVEVGVTW